MVMSVVTEVIGEVTSDVGHLAIGACLVSADTVAANGHFGIEAAAPLIVSPALVCGYNEACIGVALSGYLLSRSS